MSKTVLSLIKPRCNLKPISPLTPHFRRLINEILAILRSRSSRWEESLESRLYEEENLVSDVAHHVFDKIWDPELGLKFYRWISDKTTYQGYLNYHAYSSLLKLLSRFKEFPEIDRVLGTMKNEQVSPTPDALSSLVRAYADSGLIDKALEIYCLLQKVHSCLPDVLACNSLLNVLVNNGKLGIARKVYSEMVDRDNGGNVGCINNFSVSIMVKGLCKEGKVEEGRKMIEDQTWSFTTY